MTIVNGERSGWFSVKSVKGMMLSLYRGPFFVSERMLRGILMEVHVCGGDGVKAAESHCPTASIFTLLYFFLPFSLSILLQCYLGWPPPPALE